MDKFIYNKDIKIFPSMTEIPEATKAKTNTSDKYDRKNTLSENQKWMTYWEKIHAHLTMDYFPNSLIYIINQSDWDDIESTMKKVQRN